MATQITIRGRQYTLRSDEPSEDVEAVAAYVDRKMAEIARSSFDEYTVALLACLNVASEFHRFRKRVNADLEELDKEAGAIGAILEAALPEEVAPDEEEAQEEQA